MSNDQISVTTSTSWFSRLGSAIKGVLFGFVVILAAIVLLFWNEGRSIESVRTNKEGAGAVISVDANRVDAANNGKLVHISAAASAEGHRRDDVTGVAADGLVLSRSVEYLQWVESSQSDTRTKLGGGQETVTTYSYTTEWTNAPQDSARFNQPQGHQNPPATLKDGTFAADQASIGAFKATAPVLSQLTAQTNFTPSAEQVQAASSALGRPVSAQENVLFVGQNAATPQVGDMRITYHHLPQNTVLSVIGAQTGNEITPFIAKTGSPILMVRTGTASATEMFQAAKAANQTMSWILRGVGLAAMIAGFGMLLAPLGVLGDVVPFIGSIVRMGTGLMAGAVGLALSLVVIALAWLAFRPVVAIILLAVAGAAVAGVLWMRKRKPVSAPAV